MSACKAIAMGLVLGVGGFGGCTSADRNGSERVSLTDIPGQTGCRSIESGPGPAGSDSVRLEKVVGGLEVPWGIAFLPSGDWLVTERPGRIRLVRNGELHERIVATIAVGEPGEGGLLGIAAHPLFSENRLFYVYYTVEKSGTNVNRVEKYRLSEDGASAEAERVILDDIPAGTFHNGGRIRFGPDGMLYVGTGDARDPRLSQSDDSLAGKLLRITDEGVIPSDNPVAGRAFFLKGIRNTQGFDWFRPDVIILTDHGPTGELGRTGNDELTVATAGANLGWPDVFGCQTGAGFTAPSLVWREAVPPGGAAIYTGTEISSWKGNLLIGTLGSKNLQRIIFDADGSVRSETYFAGDPPGGFGRLRDVVMGPDGGLYVTTSNCDGRGECGADRDGIYRLRPGP